MAPTDKKALSNTLIKVSQLVADYPQIKEMDLNPVFGLEKGAMVADARLAVR